MVGVKISDKIYLILLSFRSYTKDVEYFHFTNHYLDQLDRIMYCLYVSIDGCSYFCFGYFKFFTTNSSRWKSSFNCCGVKTNSNEFLIFLSYLSFPPQFIGSLLGVMWTTVGIISFATYGLVRIAANSIHLWRVRIFSAIDFLKEKKNILFRLGL